MMADKATNDYVPNMCPACLNAGKGVIDGEFRAGDNKSELIWSCFTGGHSYRLKITKMRKSE